MQEHLLVRVEQLLVLLVEEKGPVVDVEVGNHGQVGKARPLLLLQGQHDLVLAHVFCKAPQQDILEVGLDVRVGEGLIELFRG